MNIPKILAAIGGAIVAGLLVDSHSKKEVEKFHRRLEKDYIQQQKIEADGQPEHMTDKTE